MRNLKMTIEYDGFKYKGWQRQKDTDLTIQGKIEAVLSKMTGEAILLVGCGRTDSGVHAENYIANFHTKCAFSIDTMMDYLYEYLPEDIGIKAIEDVAERFHARYNVKSKTYIYNINNNKFRDVFNRKYSYHLPDKLSISEMKQASEVLIGSHDFQSFTNMRNSDKSTVRTINYINIIEKNGLLVIEVNGNGFLLNMVRIIVGTLIEVGKGNLKAIDVEKTLNEKKRSEAGPLAQAKGLFLREVIY
ncbi:tRNA pseudouridine(38-40) synthase TruA [Desulfosporosinus sp.]|uniref:tRNA pseudouridine(38-40) synthase TruA n=1 Tax=Desulfosporosinus sp. TaxID=157907 RepID=UPI0025C366A2|nr:tRNA pseudouridine(38-40) synthase TruA [Desulfosporosinus sp.]MBC2722412.1 tRNA pseudouridine(38-40) synthase TruA [Desulfosporosinus sp.]MBC2726579.1 tRNA pseudouridine(38-40) synthase TruA [Desulfosporosinus sp.]